MRGFGITVASMATIIWALGSQVLVQADAPVVGLKQPSSVLGYSCSCSSCQLGMACSRGLHSDRADGPTDDVDSEARGGSRGVALESGPAVAAYFDFDAMAIRAVSWTGQEHINTPPQGAAWGWDATGCDATAGYVACDSLDDGTAACGRCRAKLQCVCLNLCRQPGWWIRAEAVLWWSSNSSVPALATSSPWGTDVDEIGILGLPTTSVLSSDSLYDDLRGGGRIRLGKWAQCGLGFESTAWVLGNLTDQQAWQSDGDPGLARPFTNVDPLATGPAAELVAADGVLSGILTMESSSEIYGGDAGLRKQLVCCSDPCSSFSYRVDGYAGYRYFRIREGLRISESLESTAFTGPTVLGTTIDLYDDFRTRNEFHGGNLGVIALMQRGCWTAEVVSKLAIGNLRRQVRIDGQNTVTVPTFAPLSRPGGLLAQPTNQGSYVDNDFAVLPEIQLNLSYALSNCTRLSVGYTFMYLGEIVRPGDTIDSQVNGLQLDTGLSSVGPSNPHFSGNDSAMWLMGITLGAEVKF